MKILLTGHKGFIGSLLLQELRKKDNAVYTTEMDMRNHKGMSNWIKKHKPDCLIHLASTNSIRYSFEHPLEVMDVNFISTINIAEACARTKNIKQFIFASSTEVYGDILKPGIAATEISELSPTSPHAVSKMASEIYIKQLAKKCGLPYTILRPSNTYGRRKKSSFFIENLLNQMLHNKTIRIGNPLITKDFLFVKDHIDAYLKVLSNKKAIGQTINICSGTSYSLSQIVSKASELTNFQGKIKFNSIPIRPNETLYFKGSNSKAKKLLGWKPEYSLEKGLNETIKYLN